MVPPQPVLLVVTLVMSAHSPVARAGDEIIDLSGEVDDQWNTQAIRQAFAPVEDDRDESGSPTEFRDAFSDMGKGDDWSNPDATQFRDSFSRMSKADDWNSPSAFADAQADDRRKEMRSAKRTVRMLTNELHKAQRQGAKLGESYDPGDFPESEHALRNNPISGNRSGAPALDSNRSQFAKLGKKFIRALTKGERKNYRDGYEEHHLGVPEIQHKEYEPSSTGPINVKNASMNYFEDLKARQRADVIKKMTESTQHTDVLDYPYAGEFCSYQLQQQLLKLGECERSSPIRCNRQYQLCEMRSVQRGHGKWVDVVPLANCFRTVDCERKREENAAEVEHQRFQTEELKPMKERANKAAQEKMEERDTRRREVSDQAQQEVNRDWKQVEKQEEEALEDATLQGNAPLPTARMEAQMGRMMKHITKTRKKLKKIDSRFAQLATLSKPCHKTFKRCDKRCPPLKLAQMQTDNACTLKCKQSMASCVEKYIATTYNNVAATAKSIRSAMRAHRAKEMLAKGSAPG